ncbi:MAG: hypothetical protein CSYNP_01875 [Syntrophus sp. SKADARSKE-3]|nr:hypothetical protein [Syntrophus sp. SKADARSKE-3]
MAFFKTFQQRKIRLLSVAVVVAVIGMAILFACSPGSSGNNTSSIRRQTAESGLETLRSMAESSDYLFFGYESPSDVGKEELGEPITVKTIDIETLLTSDVPNDAMIIEKNEYVFPVMVRSKPIGAVQIMLKDDTWEYVAIGSKSDVEKALNIISANALAIEDIYLLNLEEVEMAFMGYKSNGRQILIPLYKSAAAPFVPGVKYAFKDIALFIKNSVISAKASYADMAPPVLNDKDTAKDSAVTALSRSPSSSSRTVAGSAKTHKELDIPLFPQEQDEWCWAATGTMTMIFAGGDQGSITQCAQANDAFGQSGCCMDGGTSQCNKPYRPSYEKWGFRAEKVYNAGGAALSWTELKGYIDSGKPVAFLWKWRHGGGHYMVAVGYYEDTTTYPTIMMVLINNPWPPDVGKREAITYAKWVGGTRYNNLQTCYFYNIVKN